MTQDMSMANLRINVRFQRPVNAARRLFTECPVDLPERINCIRSVDSNELGTRT
jgi:head-tail adaptor